MYLFPFSILAWIIINNLELIKECLFFWKTIKLRLKKKKKKEHLVISFANSTINSTYLSTNSLRRCLFFFFNI